MRIVLDADFHRDRKELYNEFRMGELLGSPLPQESAFATDLVVNFFDGGPRTSVEYRIGGARAGDDGARAAAGSVRRGSFRPQRSDQKTLGEGRAVIAYLVGTAARATLKPAPTVLRCGRSTNMAASTATI